MLLRQRHMLKPDIKIVARLHGEEVDFHGGGNRHVATGRIEVGHMKDADRPSIGDGAVD